MAADGLQVLYGASLESACDWPDPGRERLLQRLHERHGPGIAAVLVYGSYLRGRRDTLLDFYVLLDGYAALRPRWHAALAWLLSPNVYQVASGSAGDDLRAKYAVVTLGRFERAVRKDFHPYFWARFAQPSGLIYCRDAGVRERIVAAMAEAGRHFVARVVPGLPDAFAARDLVVTGLGLTYGCELRTERPGQAEALYAHGESHYRHLVATLSAAGLGYRENGAPDRYRNLSGWLRRSRGRAGWLACRLLGKLKSALRLVKAALTFDGGFDYVLWKIERHSGQRIEPTERQRRHPLLFGWPLLWRLYRRGAFR